jgi:DNA invertase Pin-like site-specific DNA recombinase
MVPTLPNNPGLRIGYARVSTHEQSLDLQTDGLRAAGCERVYSDKVSGVKDARPGLERLKDALRPGDTLVVRRLDRLGRSLSDLIGWTGWLEQNKIGFLSLKERIDTTHSTGRLTFHLFAALAEFERELVRERTTAGLIAARARGRRGGRPRALNAAQARQLRAMRKDNTIPVGQICETLGIARTTLYSYLKHD